jgi:hypothetical protein
VEIQTQPDRSECRLIILRRAATDVLVSTRPPAPALPRLEVLIRRRIAEQAVSGVRQNYQLETVCLWSRSAQLSPELSSNDSYAVLEVLDRDAESTLGTTWMPAAAAACEGILASADQTLLRSSLEAIDRNIARPEVAPFGRPGWTHELFSWIEDQIGPLGIRPTGKFGQLNASPTFSLLRIETTGRAVWFKATGEPNKHELPITIALDRAFPNYVPRVLAVHPTWNGWLSEEVPGRALDDFRDPQTWADTAATLAELQIESIGKTTTLLESGVKDLRFDQLTREIDPFLWRMRELMALQTKEPPPILTDSDFSFLGDRLKASFCEFGQSGLPMTLGHLDPNPGNILVSRSRCCFLDWAEASVSHPFFTFEYFYEHTKRNFPKAEIAADKVVAAYLGPWRSIFSLETLLHAMDISPLLAVFAYAVAHQTWRSSETLRNPVLARCFRSLTRRAWREATKRSARREICLT